MYSGVNSLQCIFSNKYLEYMFAIPIGVSYNMNRYSTRNLFRHTEESNG